MGKLQAIVALCAGTLAASPSEGRMRGAESLCITTDAFMFIGGFGPDCGALGGFGDSGRCEAQPIKSITRAKKIAFFILLPHSKIGLLSYRFSIPYGSIHISLADPFERNFRTSRNPSKSGSSAMM